MFDIWIYTIAIPIFSFQRVPRIFVKDTGHLQIIFYKKIVIITIHVSFLLLFGEGCGVVLIWSLLHCWCFFCFGKTSEVLSVLLNLLLGAYIKLSDTYSRWISAKNFDELVAEQQHLSLPPIHMHDLQFFVYFTICH